MMHDGEQSQPAARTIPATCATCGCRFPVLQGRALLCATRSSESVLVTSLPRNAPLAFLCVPVPGQTINCLRTLSIDGTPWPSVVAALDS